MKKKSTIRIKSWNSSIIISIMFLGLCQINGRAQFILSSRDTNFFDMKARYSNLYISPDTVESSIYPQFQQFENFWGPRLAPHGNFNIAASAYRQYALENAISSGSQRSLTNWVCVGPNNSPAGAQCGDNNQGRIQAIAIDPDDGTIYAGSPYGGVFFSTDEGLNWANFYTDEQLPFVGVSDIVICKEKDSEKKFILIATGDSDANQTFSIGIYRLEIGVNSWTPINTGLFSTYQDFKKISKLLVNPLDNAIIYAGTSDGIFKCTNALSKNPAWSIVYHSPIQGVNTYIKGLEFEPNDSSFSHIYASGTDIIESYDGGSSWTSKTGSTTAIAFNGDDTPGEDIRLINIAASGDYLYAYIVTDNYQYSTSAKYKKYYIYNFNRITGLWTQGYSGKNTDGFHDVSESRMALAAVNNDVYWGFTTIHHSHDNGITPDNPFRYGLVHVHPDMHKFLINNNNLYIGSDGGISKIPVTPGSFSNSTAVSLNGKGLTVGTIYKISNAANVPDNIVLIGEMDNGSAIKNNAASTVPWRMTTPSDGGEQCVKNNDEWITSASYSFFNYYYNSNSTQRRIGKPCAAWLQDWNGPVEYSPASDKFYVGFNELSQLTDAANSNYSSWYGAESVTHPNQCWPVEQGWKIISNFHDQLVQDYGISCYYIFVHTFKIAPSNPDVMYVGVTYATIDNAACGPFGETHFLFKTTTGGLTYDAITNPGGCESNCWTVLQAPRLCGTISSIAIDPVNPDRVWISGKGFINGLATSHILFSGNGGITWSDFSRGLPDLPVNSIIYEAGSNDQLYAATDAGVYFNNPILGAWQKYGNGLPNVIVNDLEINYPKGVLYAGTFGRGLWESPLECSASPSKSCLSPLAVDEKIAGSSNEFQLIPNPGTGLFQITITKNEKALGIEEIKVFDIMGKIIWERGVSANNTFNIDITDYPQGIYYIRIINELGEVKVKKLVKQ